MSDAASLYLVFLALYVLQCLRLVDSGALILEKSLLGGWQIRRSTFQFGRQGKALILLNPIIPSGLVFAPGRFSFDLAPTGFSLAPNLRELQKEEIEEPVPYPDETSLQQRGTQLVFSEGQVIQLTNEPQARLWHDIFTDLSRTPASEREEKIDALVAAQLARSASEEKVELHWRATRALRIVSFCLTLVLFVLAPLMWSWWGSVETVTILGLPVIVLWISCATLFHAAHRKLYPEERSTRRQLTFHAAVYLPGALRAGDQLSLSLFEDSHVVAVARALGDQTVLHRAASIVTMDHPVLPPADLTDSRHNVRQSFARTVGREMAKILAEGGLPTESEGASAEPSGDAAEWYCPRCLARYRLPRAFCSDCPDTPLQKVVR